MLSRQLSFPGNTFPLRRPPLRTAVLFLVFNRPETTEAVFKAIREAKPPRLYVAADGPREGRVGERERVELARAIAIRVDWECEVKTLFRDVNLGCQFGPIGGIDWFFHHEECGIILEDDCLPSQSFFWFCEEMLIQFRNDYSVMAVTGTNITKEQNFEADYFFSKYPLMWGWASWKRAWVRYDRKLSNWEALRRTKWLRSLNPGSFLFEHTWKRNFDRTVQLSSNATWWDYQWIYTCWLNQGLTVAPAKNLIRNIGYSSDATHTTGYHSILSNLELNDLNWPLRAPTERLPDSRVDMFISRHWFGADLRVLCVLAILRLPGVEKIAKIVRRYFKLHRPIIKS